MVSFAVLTVVSAIFTAISLNEGWSDDIQSFWDAVERRCLSQQ